MWKVSLFYSIVLTDVGFLPEDFHESKEMLFKVMKKGALVTRCHQRTFNFFKKSNLWNTTPVVFGSPFTITAHAQVFTVLYSFTSEPSSL